MNIEHNKKVKLNNPTPYPSGSNTKPNPTLGKPTPAPQQVHQHSQDEPTEEPPPDTSTQTLVNKCLAESGIDPTDIQNAMPVSYAKRNISSHESSRPIKDMYVRELDLAMCVSPSSNGSKMRSLWTNQMKS